MGKSVWHIFTFGALGALILTLFMCMSLDQFQQSPASSELTEHPIKITDALDTDTR